jgi:hypothetical protein
LREKGHHTCPVCGWPKLEEAPWGLDGETASFDNCPCCSTEFGWSDDIKASGERGAGKEDRKEAWAELRRVWIRGGMKFSFQKYGVKPPEGWDPVKQLTEAGYLTG